MTGTSGGGATGPSQAAILRSLHVTGRPLLLPNVWDAATARLVAREAGAARISLGTTLWRAQQA